MADRALRGDSSLTVDDVAPGEEFEIALQDEGGESIDYEIVCLPNDFPDIVATTLASGASSDRL